MLPLKEASACGADVGHTRGLWRALRHRAALAEGGDCPGVLHRRSQVGVHGEADHPDLGVGGMEQPGGVHPIQAGHLGIHEDEVRAQAVGKLHRLFAGARLPYDGNVALLLKEVAHRLADERVIIDYEHPNYWEALAHRCPLVLLDLRHDRLVYGRPARKQGAARRPQVTGRDWRNGRTAGLPHGSGTADAGTGARFL